MQGEKNSKQDAPTGSAVGVHAQSVWANDAAQAPHVTPKHHNPNGTATETGVLPEPHRLQPWIVLERRLRPYG